MALISRNINDNIQNFIGHPLAQKCWRSSTVIVAMLSLFLVLLFVAAFALGSTCFVQIIFIDAKKPALYSTDQKFLSIALDTSVIANGFKGFNMTNSKLIKLMKTLSPSYLRIGGTLADRLIFSPNNRPSLQTFYSSNMFDGGDCAYESKLCGSTDRPNFTMTGPDWLKLTNLARAANLDVVFDLNSLTRFENGSWDFRNAEELIEFSDKNDLHVNWELGNEPNAFRHQFNYEVSAVQMAKDFSTLRRILDKYPRYKHSILVGPDTTRPERNHKESELYLMDFLKGAGQIISAVTWHQYYLNGRNATPENFTDPKLFNVLKEQIKTVKEITEYLTLQDKQIWLGETSSAYGGGAPCCSSKYVGTFIWADKLGVSAKMGIDVVIRQSIFQGDYALLDGDYNPNPDWWISVLYKRLVGTRVVPSLTVSTPKVRLYSHCSKTNGYSSKSSSVTVFGINLGRRSVKVRIEGLVFLEENEGCPEFVDAYEITGCGTSKKVYLNGKVLELTASNDVPEFIPKRISACPYISMPSFSTVFWVISNVNVNACTL